MATNLTLQVAGMLNLPVKAENALASEDSSTKLRSVCCGGGLITEGENAGQPMQHDPVVPVCEVKCGVCGRSQTSWHGWDSARDNGDGTFTVPDAEEVAAAKKPGEEYTKQPAMLVHPLEQVESQTMPNGRTYFLKLMKDKDAPLYGAFVDVVDQLRAEGQVPVIRWAVSSAVATFQLVTLGRLLALQELATPDMLKARPAVDFPEPRAEHVAIIKTAAMLASEDFVAANYENEQAKLVAKALANGQARNGGAAPLAPTATGSMDDMMAQLKARLASGDTVPAQPLPSEVPANVDTTLVKSPAPRKRAPTKKAAATRKAAPKVA